MNGPWEPVWRGGRGRLWIPRQPLSSRWGKPRVDKRKGSTHPHPLRSQVSPPTRRLSTAHRGLSGGAQGSVTSLWTPDRASPESWFDSRDRTGRDGGDGESRPPAGICLMLSVGHSRSNKRKALIASALAMRLVKLLSGLLDCF
jgi:hypothetical protein